jgi:hypothetical protein
VQALLRYGDAMNAKSSPEPLAPAPLQARVLVTREELAALLGPTATELDAPAAAPRTAPANPAAKSPVDTWFKHRLWIPLTVGFAYSVKLSFFTDSAASNFSGLGLDLPAMVDYARFRVFTAMLLITVYLYSYLNNWHFERLSVFFLGLAVGALVLDYAHAYALLLDKPPGPLAFALLALRLMVVYCMVMNALNARRAPSMPRRLWL